jgi:lysophospholipase L1-like esterase
VPFCRWILCLLVCCAPLAFSSSAAAAPIRTLLVGDSITFGVVSGAGGPSYAELLASDLAGTHDVVNVAQSGTSAVYWAPSTPCPGICSSADNLFDELATPELPADVATILLGTNDAIGFFLPDRTAEADYESFMREIVDALFDGGVSSVVLMTAPVGNVSAEAETLLAGYRDRIGGICLDTASVVCGPDLFMLLDPVTDFAPGDLHPNATGHMKIAGALETTLLSLPEPGTGTLVGLALSLLLIRLPSAVRHQ